jgi:hypothetical protein
MAISIIQLYIKGQIFPIFILVPWCKCQVSIHIYFLCLFLILNIHFSCYLFIVYCCPCLVSYVELYNWYAIYFLVLLVHNAMIIVREKNWDHFNQFLLCFSFHNPKVKNFHNTHGCPSRNQNDILDNPIPCKWTLSVYSIWSINYRYDSKYAPQYKSKHTNYVKLSNLVL